MIGKSVALFFSTSRDLIAKRLIAVGITANMVTGFGVFLTACAGLCYALGVSTGFGMSFDPHKDNVYIILAGLLIYWASACDMLDGAVARISQKMSKFGAFLDSSLDRFSDFAIYAGITLGYALAAKPNITFMLLSLFAMFNSFMISYTKARAENLIESCPVGYWQRGERSAAVLIATFAHNIPALVVQQSLSTCFSYFRRMWYTNQIMKGKSPILDPREGNFWMKIKLWRWKRMTWQYDLITIINILWLIFARFEPVDVLRKIFGN